MKESNSDKYRKHSKHSHGKRDETNNHSDKYRNVLKERPYRDEFVHDKRASCEDKNHSKDKQSAYSQKHGRHKPEKRDTKEEESYEELSRKKRKIESELHALDLEEAEEAERLKRLLEQEKKKDAPIRIKKEPLSDDETRKRSQKPKSKDEVQNHHKPQSSKPSGDEKRPWGNSQVESKKPEKAKEKPNFAVSGKLAEDTNTYNGVVIKYNEPGEARKPRKRWRLYPFKGDSELPFIPIHRQSAYLFGRTRSIADIPIDHPSCSKQHAVLQFRLVPYQREDGTKGRRVRPYIIDLESSNGTFVNNKKVEARCYVELMEKDVVKFGFSTREYVLLHEESRNDEEDEGVIDSN